MKLSSSPQEVVDFRRKAGPERWFTRDDGFDELCRTRFLSTYEQAAAGELDHWEQTPEGALALVILLDQMPRNMFRDNPKAWATDAAAQLVAERAVDGGFDLEVDPALRRFLYLPFMHAEDPAAQERSLQLHEAWGDPDAIRWAKHHHGVVDRFGRFPHRNAVLGRESTPEELAYLDEGVWG